MYHEYRLASGRLARRHYNGRRTEPVRVPMQHVDVAAATVFLWAVGYDLEAFYRENGRAGKEAEIIRGAARIRAEVADVQQSSVAEEAK